MRLQSCNVDTVICNPAIVTPWEFSLNLLTGSWNIFPIVCVEAKVSNKTSSPPWIISSGDKCQHDPTPYQCLIGMEWNHGPDLFFSIKAAVDGMITVCWWYLVTGGLTLPGTFPPLRVTLSVSHTDLVHLSEEVVGDVLLVIIFCAQQELHPLRGGVWEGIALDI